MVTTDSPPPLSVVQHRSSGMYPLGLTTLNRKNHPIVMTLGGIVSCYASLTLHLIAFYPCHKLRDNILVSLSGNTKSKLPQDDNFSVSLASRLLILQDYLATPLGCFPFSLRVSSKLSATPPMTTRSGR
jgi:hypothetical protein